MDLNFSIGFSVQFIINIKDETFCSNLLAKALSIVGIETSRRRKWGINVMNDGK